MHAPPTRPVDPRLSKPSRLFSDEDLVRQAESEFLQGLWVGFVLGVAATIVAAVLFIWGFR